MKIELTVKTPDAFDQAFDNLTVEQIEDDEFMDNFKQGLDEYIEYGEYIRLEYDTETKAMTVKKV